MAAQSVSYPPATEFIPHSALGPLIVATGTTGFRAMALSSGVRFGPDEILTLIGKAGWGEVYRARDTKLGREVAIKVLPEEFVNDGERLARFEREARLLASLDHPNIAGIYDVEESDGDGVKALVLELVEGPTLAEPARRARALHILYHI